MQVSEMKFKSRGELNAFFYFSDMSKLFSLDKMIIQNNFIDIFVHFPHLFPDSYPWIYDRLA